MKKHTMNLAVKICKYFLTWRDLYFFRAIFAFIASILIAVFLPFIVLLLICKPDLLEEEEHIMFCEDLKEKENFYNDVRVEETQHEHATEGKNIYYKRIDGMFVEVTKDEIYQSN